MNIYSILESINHNQHYLKRYYTFILSCSLANSSRNIQGYTEKHHICPRSLFPEYDKNKSNIVVLTARQHYIAHRLLWRAYPGNIKMTKAFMMMSTSNDLQNRVSYSSKIYEILKRELSEYMKTSMLGENNPFFEQKHTDESKQKMRDTKSKMILIPWNQGLTKETSEKLAKVGKNISKAVDGMRHWTNGVETVKSKNQPDESWYIGRHTTENMKWSQERKIAQSEQRSSGVCNWWNNGVINKRQKDMPDGDNWIRGRLFKENSKFKTDKDYLKKYTHYKLKRLSDGFTFTITHTEYKILKKTVSIGQELTPRKRPHDKKIEYVVIDRVANKTYTGNK